MGFIRQGYRCFGGTLEQVFAIGEIKIEAKAQTKKPIDSNQ